ncbi:MAG: PTS sugar transporter subunit IIA [Kiritimatiellia bacterium]|jgi:mannitol/fructose-specific phosphotransferase system IIA component (Ntr-type)|nr:PTS sugar transporter subunit IIA [Kiritimatiellia bacterium]
MHPVANHIIQLQELTLIRDEQRIAERGEHLEQLNASIKTMTGQLSKNVRMTFEKLQKRDPIAIAPVSGSNCSVCGMALPISLQQSIRMGKEIHSCPNCARMLYAPEDAPKRVGERTRRTGPRKVGISRFSSHTLMIPCLEGEDKESCISELAFRMEEEGFVEGADMLVEEALRREAIVSTAFVNGLAFPHVRGVEGGGLTLAVGVSKKGVKFEKDAKPSHIIFFIVIPTAASAFYLKLLSGLSKAFSKKKNCEAMLAETVPEKMWKILARVTRTTIK